MCFMCFSGPLPSHAPNTSYFPKLCVLNAANNKLTGILPEAFENSGIFKPTVSTRLQISVQDLCTVQWTGSYCQVARLWNRLRMN